MITLILASLAIATARAEVETIPPTEARTPSTMDA